jgi:hypothetical protein
MKDYRDPQDANQEVAPNAERLSATGRRAMQGDAVAALEQRLEEVRAETEAREAAERSELDRQAAERARMVENQATTAGTDASPDPPPGHHPQFSTTERGNEVKIEGGAEMSERKRFSNIDESSESEASIYREGRLR